MKLAEALAERKALSDRATALAQRARHSVIAPEGRTPVEAVAEILVEIEQALERWEERVVQINRTNVEVRLGNGLTLMEALARRDRLTRQFAILMELMQVVTGGPHDRFAMVPREIPMVPTIDMSGLQGRIDALSGERMALDLAIQQAGWVNDVK